MTTDPTIKRLDASLPKVTNAIVDTEATSANAPNVTLFGQSGPALSQVATDDPANPAAQTR